MKRGNKLTRTGSLRVHQDARGDLHVVADVTGRRFGGAFPVRMAAADEVAVGLGTVEGLTPRLQQVPLDGVDGKKAVRVPNLPLKEGPNAELRSWVCLRVQVDLAVATAQTAAAEQRPLLLGAEIVHLNDLAKVFANGVSPDDGAGHGYFPIAMIVWRDKEIVKRLVRNTYFNQRHSFIPGREGRGSFHLFRPAV
jgi:hypothetical protein